MSTLAVIIVILLMIGHRGPDFVFENGNPGLPVCPTITPTTCLANFTLTDYTDGIVYSNIPPTAKSYKVTGKTRRGRHVYTLVINGRDQNGEAIVSPAATTIVKVP